MINILIGPPGGGKSYEAVVHHVLPALANGRKVITNLPLQMNRIAAIDASFVPLIEIRMKTLASKPVVDWDKAERLHSRFGIVAKMTTFRSVPLLIPRITRIRGGIRCPVRLLCM